MISDEQRAALGDLAMRAFDAITDEYGEDATLGDAVLLYEVHVPDGDGGIETHTHWEATTHRPVVLAGLLSMTLAYVQAPEE